jgi:hypothetical protein
MTTIPSSILESAHDLSPDALVSLFRLVLTDGTTFRFSSLPQLTWQGDVYEELGCSIAQSGRSSDGKVHRPRVSIVNPGGLFTGPVNDGLVENALIYRYQILKADLDADNDFALVERYKVFRVVNVMTGGPIVLETRDVLDGYRSKLPRREFIPPEFSHVRLQ